MSIDKMTPTPWKRNGLQIHSNGKYLLSAHCGGPMEEVKANSEAIVMAVNSTYGAGINPESVKDIRDTLNAILNIQLNGGDLSDLRHYDLLQEAKAAIEKAKL